MAIWQVYRGREKVLTMEDLARLVQQGFTLSNASEKENDPVKNFAVKLPVKLHDRLDSIAETIPGMTKEKLVKFILDAAVYEFCRAFIDQSLFPIYSDEEIDPEEIITEALSQMDLYNQTGE